MTARAVPSQSKSLRSPLLPPHPPGSDSGAAARAGFTPLTECPRDRHPSARPRARIEPSSPAKSPPGPSSPVKPNRSGIPPSPAGAPDPRLRQNREGNARPRPALPSRAGPGELRRPPPALLRPRGAPRRHPRLARGSSHPFPAVTLGRELPDAVDELLQGRRHLGGWRRGRALRAGRRREEEAEEEEGGGGAGREQRGEARRSHRYGRRRRQPIRRRQREAARRPPPCATSAAPPALARSAVAIATAAFSSRQARGRPRSVREAVTQQGRRGAGPVTSGLRHPAGPCRV